MKKTLMELLVAPASGLVVAGGLGCIAIASLGSQPLSASPILAEISINIGIEAGPPPMPREVMVATPGPGYVWVGGYYNGSPGHYQLTRGHWERPPHGKTRWTAPKWDKDRDGHYHKTEGSWR